MEGKASHSLKKKKLDEKLSKTVGGKSMTKKSILNRNTSGKKRPKSEPRVKKSPAGPMKDDFLAKRLFEDEGEDVDAVESKPTPVKPKKRKSNVLKPSSPVEKAAKTPLSSTSKWQVTETSSVKEVAKEASVKKSVKKVAKSKKVSKRRQEDEVDNVDEGLEESNVNQFDSTENDDDEIDFPVLKRKSLGLSAKKPSKSPSGKKAVATKVLRETSQNGQTEEKTPEMGKRKNRKRKKGKDENKVDVVTEEKKGVEGQDEKKNKEKKKRKRRGRKRKRSNSESEEPEAKKDKPDVDEFAVRCGNLPVGVGKLELTMFIGEADVFPKSVAIKSKKKSPGEKKHAFKYATIYCNSAEEVKKLCNLNGISMPSTVGNKDSRLLIHTLAKDSSDDSSLASRRKLFIRNLHPKVTEDDLKEFFEERGFNPTNAIIARKGEKKSKQYGFVWLATPEDVNRAVGVQAPSLRDQVFTIARSNKPDTKQEA